MNTIEPRLEEMLARYRTDYQRYKEGVSGRPPDPNLPRLVQALRRVIGVLQAVPPPNPFWHEADGALADIAKILTEGKE